MSTTASRASPPRSERGRARRSLATATLAAFAITFSSFAASEHAVAAPKELDYVGDGLLAHRLDLYSPQSPSPRPLAIWIHGGAWRAGTKDSVPIISLLRHGWAIASVEYRLSPEAPFPAQMHDIKAAIRYLRGNATQLGLDPRRFVILGSSAGGHLAALAGLSDGARELEGELGEHRTETSEVAAVVSFFGASNFRTILGQSTDKGLSVRIPALQLFIGGLPSDLPEIADLASPIHHLDAEDPPVLLIHGDADPQMPYAQSVELKDALDAAKVRSDLITVHGGEHGGPEFFSPERLDKVLRFLERNPGFQIKLPPQGNSSPSLIGEIQRVSRFSSFRAIEQSAAEGLRPPIHHDI